MTKKSYREWNPSQRLLLPPSPMDWLQEDDLDRSAIEASHQNKQRRGTRPHDPRMMAALLLYGHSSGIVSSRKIERAR